MVDFSGVPDYSSIYAQAAAGQPTPAIQQSQDSSLQAALAALGVTNLQGLSDQELQALAGILQKQQTAPGGQQQAAGPQPLMQPGMANVNTDPAQANSGMTPYLGQADPFVAWLKQQQAYQAGLAPWQQSDVALKSGVTDIHAFDAPASTNPAMTGAPSEQGSYEQVRYGQTPSDLAYIQGLQGMLEGKVAPFQQENGYVWTKKDIEDNLQIAYAKLATGKWQAAMDAFNNGKGAFPGANAFTAPGSLPYWGAPESLRNPAWAPSYAGGFLGNGVSGGVDGSGLVNLPYWNNLAYFQDIIDHSQDPAQVQQATQARNAMMAQGASKWDYTTAFPTTGAAGSPTSGSRPMTLDEFNTKNRAATIQRLNTAKGAANISTQDVNDQIKANFAKYQASQAASQTTAQPAATKVTQPDSSAATAAAGGSGQSGVNYTQNEATPKVTQPMTLAQFTAQNQQGVIDRAKAAGKTPSSSAVTGTLAKDYDAYLKKIGQPQG